MDYKQSFKKLLQVVHSENNAAKREKSSW